MEPAILARGVKKRFRAVAAADGIDLEVPRGSCFGLIGANGAGKTTFIKLLLGIASADAGDIRVLGEDPRDVHSKKRIGYLPERLTIPESFSPLQFLQSVAGFRGVGSDSAARRVEMERVLDVVGLERAAWKRASGKLSKGMKQRTGMAAAVLGSPELLILDEPTDGIDPMGRAQIRDVIVQAQRAGATVFLNSHLLAESEKICDHVAILARGRVMQSGSLDVLKRKDAHRVRFARSEGDVERARRHGFFHVEDREEDRVYRMEGALSEQLSRALHAAIGDGLVVVEVARETKDLEMLLRESTEAKP